MWAGRDGSDELDDRLLVVCLMLVSRQGFVASRILLAATLPTNPLYRSAIIFLL